MENQHDRDDLLDDVRRQLKENEGNIVKLTDEVGNLSKRVTGLTDEFSGFKANSAVLNGNIERLLDFFDGNGNIDLKSRLSGIEYRLQQIEKDLDEDQKKRGKFNYWIAGLIAATLLHLLSIVKDHIP